MRAVLFRPEQPELETSDLYLEIEMMRPARRAASNGGAPRTTLQKVICNFDILFVILDASQQQNSLFISYTELYNAVVNIP